MRSSKNEPNRQILGRVQRDEFVGRAGELQNIVTHASQNAADRRGLLVMLSPVAGVSELLRQAFDELFNQRGNVVPILFSLPQSETTTVSAAIEFLNTFLRQYLAFRRNEPALCQASLTLDYLVQLTPAADLDWVQTLVDSYKRQRFSDDDAELVRLCLTAPARVPAKVARPFVMFDAVHLPNFESFDPSFAAEIVRALTASGRPFVLAGLRRGIVYAVERAGTCIDTFETIRLDRLNDGDARGLVSSAAGRYHVAITDETRDLLVQQLERSPFLITSLLQAAREHGGSLESYFSVERLYVDELLGGRLHRAFSSVLESVAPDPQIRAGVVRLLCESVPENVANVSVDSWRRRLKIDELVFDQLLRRLHIEELINWDGETINPSGSSRVWSDYLRSRFRLDALREPRALVVADVMADALKRAPRTMEHHYRRSASLPLRELLGKFNAQLVPRVLLEYAAFADAHKGTGDDEIVSALDAETELVRLPQVFHVASAQSYSKGLREFGEETTVVAHGFEQATYTDANEVVWLVAKLESKLEAKADLVQRWLGLLEGVARQSGFVRTQFWLIANEGFSAEATELLRHRGAYASSLQQIELLTARLSETRAPSAPSTNDEFTLVVPMGADNELLAAMTVEQLARRIQFSREAINQIKTAVVEACINATEHSLSPDRKIYQRFRVEDDKLVITISSRGVLPVNISEKLDNESRAEKDSDERRGWGLKLIKTLMDEVEFERVDEGTSLRMTKYLRKSS